MDVESPQIAARRRVDAFREAALLASAMLDWQVRTRVEGLSRRAMIAMGVLTTVVAVLAYLRGADVRAGLAGSQPGRLPSMLASLSNEDRTAAP